MITEGVVTELGKTEKGTPKAKIDGKWYFASRGVQLDDMKPGQKVGVEYTLFGEKNNLCSIKSWALLPHQPGMVQGPMPAGLSQRPGAVVAIVDEAELRFISNCVGQAIAAGTIKLPGEILAWYEAAKAALKGKPADKEEPIPY